MKLYGFDEVLVGADDQAFTASPIGNGTSTFFFALFFGCNLRLISILLFLVCGLSRAESEANSGRPSTDGFIIGQVVDQNGGGLSQVQVRDYTSDDSAVSDSRGHFAMPYKKIGPEERRLLFAGTNSAFGIADFKTAPACATPDGAPSETIVLKPRNQLLHGRLLDSKGNPVQNATIGVNGITTASGRMYTIEGETGSTAAFLNLLATSSDSNGQFTLPLPSGSSSNVQIACAGYGTLEFFNIDSSVSDIGTLILPDGGAITGRVVDRETNKPLPELVVRATRKFPDTDIGSVDRHIKVDFIEATNKEGNFRFRSLPVGTYEVEVNRDNCGVTKGDLVPGEVSLVEVKARETVNANLTMVSGRRVTGRILMGNGNDPVAGAYAINLTPSPPSQDYFWSHNDGSFTTYLLPGTYELKVDDQSDEFPPVQVTIDATKEPEPVTLRVGDDVTTVTINVRTANGQSLSNQMFIWAWAWDGQNSRGASCSEDVATFRGIKKDSHPIFIVDVPGYGIWHSEPIDVSTVTAPVEVVLQPAASVSVKGRVIDDETGKPISNLQVSAIEYLDEGIRWMHFILPNHTDNDGRFIIPGLRAGDRIRLNAFPSDPGKFRQVTITHDPSGMFDDFQNSSQGIVLSGAGPLQLPDTHVKLQAATNVENFSEHPLPDFPRGTNITTTTITTLPLAGIGAVLRAQDSQVKITNILFNGPSAKAGLLPGDILTNVDGKPAGSLLDTVNRVRGPIGTTVRIGIKRGSSTTIQYFDLKRENLANMFPNAKRHGLDLAALNKIILPENPTRDQIRNYIREIVAVSQGQSEESSIDPQVKMFEKVGPDNIDLLLERENPPIPGFRSFEVNLYIQTAVDQLARPQDRDLILSHLEERPDLIQVVINHNWQQPAKPIIVAELKKEPALFSPLWFSAAVSFHDPGLYSDLKKAFTSGPNKYMNFQELKTLPNFDLKSAVDEAWSNEINGTASLYPDKMDAYGMAVIASQYGHLDALDYLFKALAAQATVYSSWPDPRSAILSVTQTQGADGDLIDWYQKNKARLRFDSTQNKFILN